ncbi:MAG: hypothetical protein FD174_1843 [Geobacteraceae bacterium]|nr:MAG: hypothetical protein FD174_1843 [Geobacteraceae bacterium]
MIGRWPGIVKTCILISVIILAAGCATVPKPELLPTPGKEVETLQSPIVISVKTPERSMGGRGYLIFKHPDRFHLVILSPFGLTLFEVFSDGERITCAVPSKNTAYSGLVSELPDRGGMKSWGMMQWAVARPKVLGPVTGSRESVTPDGRKELVYFDEQGLLQRKVTEDGDQVVYLDYQSINGVAFPGTIELSNWRGDTVKITFDEPEINEPVEDSALAPDLDGMTVLPFTAFQGF